MAEPNTNTVICEINKECSCPRFWAGENCETNWIDIFGVWFDFYLTVVIVGNIFILCITILDVTFRIHNSIKTGEKKLNLATKVQIFIFLGSLLRIIWAIVDPHTIYGNLVEFVEDSLFNGGLILWVISYSIVILFWIELQQKAKICTDTALLSWRKILIITTFIFGFATVFTSILGYIVGDNTSIPSILYVSIFFSFFFKNFYFLNCLSTYYILKLWSTVKGISTSPKNKQNYRNVCRLIIVANIVSISSVILLMIYSGIDARSKVWVWFILQLFLRILEIMLVTTMTLIVSIIFREILNGKTLKQIWYKKSTGSTTSSEKVDSKDELKKLKTLSLQNNEETNQNDPEDTSTHSATETIFEDI